MSAIDDRHAATPSDPVASDPITGLSDQVTTAIHGFAELTLASTRPEELARFYGEVFGLSRIEDGPDRIWLGVGRTARLGIWLPGVKEFGDRGGVHVHFAFSAEPEALAEIAARARAAGAAVEGPVRHDGGDRSLYVTDPEGNRVEAWTRYES